MGQQWQPCVQPVGEDLKQGYHTMAPGIMHGDCQSPHTVAASAVLLTGSITVPMFACMQACQAHAEPAEHSR